MAAPLAVIGIAGTLIGAGISAYGKEYEGAAKEAQAQSAARIAKLNADIALSNAAYTQRAGGSAALQTGRKYGFERAQQVVAQSGSGIDVGSGSAAGVRKSTTELGVEDQNLIRTNYARKAYGYESEAAVRTTEASANLAAGKYATDAADIGAAASIVGGLSSSVSQKFAFDPAFSKALA